MKQFVLLFVALHMPGSGIAEQLFPQPQDVIASWQPANTLLTARQANQLLDEASRLNDPGYGTARVEHTLIRRQQQGELARDLIYVKARVLQRNHQFAEAAALLSGLDDPASRLLLATVNNNLGRFDEAISACKALTGKVSHAIMLTCLFDARYQQSPDAALYEQLSAVARTTQRALNDAQQLWVNSTLAAMALDLNKPTEALQHLRDISVARAPVSSVALWAQAHLQLKQPATVLNQLGSQLESPASADDAILLLLARASVLNNSDPHWQQLASQRIDQRKWRKDWSHAAYIAEYHLYIDHHSDQARYYASKNWQQAKGLADRRLLQQTGAAGESL
ncbi:tetratricopeptide repeat protein [Salinimonas lutimaris]|uniref:hypothetical protein n=1 Tax=Salinimonas lutimaris TaxID=914153 RepID=UPI0010C0216D|nr:hypothetical protein [Salinimonas lutimaris]